MRPAALTERDFNCYASLAREVDRVSLATDELVKRDAAEPGRAEDYFIFSAQAEEALLAFCRDPAVRRE